MRVEAPGARKKVFTPDQFRVAWWIDIAAGIFPQTKNKKCGFVSQGR